MATKASSYRFDKATADRIDKLAERGEISRTRVIEHAVYNMCLEEGILVEEAHDLFEEMLARHNNAVVTFAVQSGSHVPVAINGSPTHEIRAHRLLVGGFSTGRAEQPDPNAEHRVFAVVPKTAITFDLGRVKPGKVEMKLTELFQRMRPFEPRTTATISFAAAAGRAVGLEPDEEGES